MLVHDWLNGFKQGKSHLTETQQGLEQIQAALLPLDADTEIPQVFYFRRKSPMTALVQPAA
ncbi:MAG: hypothetical protein RL210_1597 [Pseudomonadota bacterium]|jgi:hypothetical protein